MRYHDYYLSKYEVSDGGETITFHLVHGYPGEETDDSCIRFSNVALYNFVHTAGAIISNIEELPVAELLQDIGAEVAEWHRLYGIKLWKDGFEHYVASLQVGGYRAWRIESAIGLNGFVIAKSVKNV